MDNSSSPAAPCIAANESEFLSAQEYDAKSAGLTKREHFAGLAMQGILAHSFGRGTPEEAATESLKLAVALLKELEK